MFNTPSPSKSIITVSQLNRLARSVLETEIGQVWLTAEISNFVAASSGHWYFTLKDNRAQVKAAMFKGANRRVAVKPKEGDKVLVRANIGLYEPRGDYQLIVEHIEPEGEGQLKQEFERLKQQLANEGLFANEQKQAIPAKISRIGIVTSATGAALHDVLTVLNRRNPAIEIILYPAQVQGEAAPAQLCNAIDIANQRDEVDVLIVGRGGGSLEDLWCFNNETLARTIFNSRLPIVSAVGHEVDVSIADFVADVRAPTPSAAAELVSPDQSHLMSNIIKAQQSLHTAFINQLGAYQQVYKLHFQGLLQNHPKRQLEQKAQLVDQLEEKLHLCFKNRFVQLKQKQALTENRLNHVSPKNTVCQLSDKLEQQQQRLQHACEQLISNKKQQLANNSHLLDTVSPLATLARGYSISYKQGEIIKSSQQLAKGDELITRFVDGEVASLVTTNTGE